MTASIYTIGGTVQASGGLYIERAADAELLTLCRAGAFAYVLTARQMGKSSLVAHTAERLIAAGIAPVLIDLTQLGTQLNAEQWYLGLLDAIAEQLALETDPIGWWRERAHLGLTQRLIEYLRDVVLAEVAGQVVVFVDEIDTTLSLAFTDDFYAAIRALYNARAQQPELRRLSFVLIGVAMPGDLIKDPQRTPFNIGQPINLTDFSAAEAGPFAEGLGLPAGAAERALGRVLHWTDGHPYLTQRLCSVLAAQPRADWHDQAIDLLVGDTFLGDRSKQDNNLQFVRDMLTRRAADPVGVLTTYRRVLRGRTVIDDERSLAKAQLKLAGVVKRDGAALRVRNRIYAAAFDARWVGDHLPRDYWTRRLQRIALVAIVALTALSVLLAAFLAGSNSREAELKNERDTAVALQQAAQAGQAAARTAEANALDAQQTAERRQQEADALRRTAENRELIARAQVATDPELRLLLTAEAARRVQSGQVADDKEYVAGALRQAIMGSHVRHVLDASPAALLTVVFSPDGASLLGIGDDERVYVWDVATGQQQRMLGDASHRVTSAQFSPDSSMIATVSRSWSSAYSPLNQAYDGTAKLWDARTGRLRATFGDTIHNVVGIAFSPDSKLIVTASSDWTARVWQIDSGAEISRLLGHKLAVTEAVFSPDGQRILTAGGDGTVRLWEASTGKQLNTFRDSNAAAFGPGGLVAASTSAGTQVWDIAAQKVVQTLTTRTSSVQTSLPMTSGQTMTAGIGGLLCFWQTGSDSPTQLSQVRLRLAASQPADDVLLLETSAQTARVVSGATGDTLAELRSPVDIGSSDPSALFLLGVVAAFSPDGERIATLGVDGRARLWDWLGVSSNAIAPLPANEQPGRATTPDGRLQLVRELRPDSPSIVHVIDTATGNQVAEWPGYVRVISPDSRLVATIEAIDKDTDKISIWDTVSYQRVSSLTLQTGSHLLLDTQFSHDDRLVATVDSGYGSTIWIWEAQSGKIVTSMHAQEEYASVLGWSQDGDRLLTKTLGSIMRLWQISTGSTILTLPHIAAAGLSADGQVVGVVTSDNILQVSDVTSGQQKMTIALPKSIVVDQLLFSPDNQYLITSGESSTQIWDIRGGQSLAQLPGGAARLTPSAASPGSLTVTVRYGGTLRSYPCDVCRPLDELVALALQRATRDLTPEERQRYGLASASG